MYKGSEAYYKYKIEISNDGSTYSTLDMTGNTRYGFTTDAVHFTARYVRINMVSAVLWNNPNNWYTPTLHEVKLLGPSTPEVTGYSHFESHNFPGYYIRHYNFAARIDPNVSPAADSQFRVVPGLASSSGVSLESINYPGYFLKRNSNNKIVLEAFANTTDYKANATFLISSGWADSSKISLQSYSQPGYYVRHYNYVLQLDPITPSSSATAKSDATFSRTNF
jgi:hypothetical protein